MAWRLASLDWSATFHATDRHCLKKWHGWCPEECYLKLASTRMHTYMHAYAHILTTYIHKPWVALRCLMLCVNFRMPADSSYAVYLLSMCTVPTKNAMPFHIEATPHKRTQSIIIQGSPKPKETILEYTQHRWRHISTDNSKLPVL